MTRADDTAPERPAGRAERERTPEAAAAAEAAEPPRVGYIGKRLGRFHITAELGRGGMATVYRAHDPHVGRDVAVKVMHGFFAGRADIEARFRREANAVAAIRHPSILALYDFTPPAGEEPGYIVSELIEGPGLRVLADERGGRLQPEVAAAIAARVAEALGAAHAAGIVHRDVKPDNVLIDRAGGGVRVVLTDFGVAHVGSMDTMTATGAVLGSPAFMSPEQARGDDVGPPSDVFSLGVLLYQLVTGHLPFTGKDPLTLIAALLRGDYIRPGKLEARVSPELEQVIVRCLQREPAARFPDGRAVASALRDALAASGFSDEEALLRRAVPDLDAFARDTAPELAERALRAAEAARKKRQVPRALAEVGRALAYVPEHAAARALLDRLGMRRRWPLVLGGVVAAAGALAVAGVIMTSVSRRPPAVVPAPAPAPALAVARPTPVTASPPSEPAPVVVAPAPPATAPAPSPSRTRSRSRAPAAARPAGSGVAPRPAASAPAAPAAAAPAPAPEPAPAAHPSHDEPPAAVASPPTAVVPPASIILRASQGFCEPSLDDGPPSLRVSTYENLRPGPHDIYCTLPQGGGKVRVQTYNLRAGTRPTLIIVRGPDGRPTLSHPE